jgi:cardiolipin synthase
MLQELISQHWLKLHSFVVVSGLVIYGVTSHSRKQRRHPSAAIAWMVSLVLLPYFALPLYLLLGSRKFDQNSAAPNTRVAIRSGQTPTTPAAKLRQLSAAMGLSQAVSYHGLEIHEDGIEALESLRSLMRNAVHRLDICTFILGRDALGVEVCEILMLRAQAGVDVRLLIDGVGVFMGGLPALKKLRRAGVNVELFAAPLSSALPGRTNLRNHRKLAIADGEKLWMGGRNLAAQYFVGDAASHPPKKSWIDLTFACEGMLATQAQSKFDQDWHFSKSGLQLDVTEQSNQNVGSACLAQCVPSGPDQADDTLYSLLISSCFSAQRRICIVTPYFVPDATLLMALTLAARRGVMVDVLLPGKSNHRLADMARYASLRDMCAAGAAIWLSPEMIHAKAILIDEDVALVGSANLDERSMFLNYEMMVAFFDPVDVRRFSEWIDRRRAGATRCLAQQPNVVYEFVEGLVRWLAFQL